MDKISVIVPCYNEELSLPIFYKELNKVSKTMKKVNFEFLFIDDGSIDKTLGLIKLFSRKDNRVRYLSFSRNFGKEAGIYAGLDNVTGNYVAIMDADMQDPPSMIETMYQLIKKESYDCIALYSPNYTNYGFIKRNLAKCFYKLMEKLSTVPQVLGARDFRLMTRKMVDSIISLGEYNRYSKCIFNFVGFDTKWIKYDAPNRVAGKTKWGFWKLVKYGIEGILSFSTKPLIISAVVGLIFCLIAFISVIIIIVKTICFGDPVGGWPSLACMIMFVSGIQLFFFGILGAYLSKIYLEVKKRPIYIIKETEKD